MAATPARQMLERVGGSGEIVAVARHPRFMVFLYPVQAVVFAGMAVAQYAEGARWLAALSAVVSVMCVGSVVLLRGPAGVATEDGVALGRGSVGRPRWTPWSQTRLTGHLGNRAVRRADGGKLLLRIDGTRLEQADGEPFERFGGATAIIRAALAGGAHDERPSSRRGTPASVDGPTASDPDDA